MGVALQLICLHLLLCQKDTKTTDIGASAFKTESQVSKVTKHTDPGFCLAEKVYINTSYTY